MSSVLIAYATKHGSTRDVAYAIAESLASHGLFVETKRAGDVGDLSSFDGVVLGSALYMGRLHPEARRFLRGHRHELGTKPLAVFAMGPRTIEQADVESSRSQLDRELRKLPELAPAATAIFGGVLDPATQHFPFNRMAKSDARDWDAIGAWAETVAGAFAAPAAIVAAG